MNETITHYRGRYLDLVERDGWEYSTRSNARAVVVIIAVTPDKRLLLVEQFRRPVDTRVIELPAGLVGDHVDPDESILEAARRELIEETGYAADSLARIMDCPSSAGMTDEIVSFIRADGLERVGPGGGDDSEDIRVHAVPLAEIDTWLDSRRHAGLPLDPKIFAALYWLERSGESS
ncbi:MAG: NUDIX hydrolase [Xanthomonadales bacterium]